MFVASYDVVRLAEFIDRLMSFWSQAISINSSIDIEEGWCGSRNNMFVRRLMCYHVCSPHTLSIHHHMAGVPSAVRYPIKHLASIPHGRASPAAYSWSWSLAWERCIAFCYMALLLCYAYHLFGELSQRSQRYMAFNSLFPNSHTQCHLTDLLLHPPNRSSHVEMSWSTQISAIALLAKEKQIARNSFFERRRHESAAFATFQVTLQEKQRRRTSSCPPSNPSDP